MGWSIGPNGATPRNRTLCPDWGRGCGIGNVIVPFAPTKAWNWYRGGSETRDVCDGLDLTHASGSPLSVKSIQDER